MLHKASSVCDPMRLPPATIGLLDCAEVTMVLYLTFVPRAGRLSPSCPTALVEWPEGRDPQHTAYDFNQGWQCMIHMIHGYTFVLSTWQVV